MINSRLQDFIDRVIGRNHISAEDVKHLHREVLPSGIGSKIEAEALLALDRTLGADESWNASLTSLIVNFVVRGLRPNGVVSNDDAMWLTTALDVGGPSHTAMAIAYAILDEAQHVDTALLDFIMRGRHWARLQNLAA
jgi:hypothetical protein